MLTNNLSELDVQDVNADAKARTASILYITMHSNTNL
jgi:hypothetical protein